MVRRALVANDGTPAAWYRFSNYSVVVRQNWRRD
jgi:hypothetical protein